MKYIYFILCIPILSLFGANDAIHLGVDVLESNQFSILQGKRVGLLTHPAGVNRKGESTIDVLNRSRQFKLVALFGPEHGIYGDEKANQPIDNKIDSRTGIPVYSLYGKYRKPQSSMLRDIDVMVIDLQDIGVRSYTYISSMRYTMEACFENDVAVVILDRPNPLGGLKIDGPNLDPEWKSYVGAFPIPYVHGLTIGECALLAKNKSGWLDIDPSLQKKGILTVVPMKGWKRSMLWPQTGLKWIATSPNIPSYASAIGYSMTGLGAQEGTFSHGIGTAYPFRILSNSLLSPKELKRKLDSYAIPGLELKPIRTQNKKGQSKEGLYVGITNWNTLKPTALSFYMMALSIEISSSNPFRQTRRSALFNKHVGSTDWWKELTERRGAPRVQQFLKKWELENLKFRNAVSPYLIYQ